MTPLTSLGPPQVAVTHTGVMCFEIVGKGERSETAISA